MTFEAVKEKLYWYIEHADQNKVMAIYTLLNEDIERETIYDKATVAMLEQRRKDIQSGEAVTYTLQESKDRIKQFRNRHGV